jgi:hypothetical protein
MVDQNLTLCAIAMADTLRGKVTEQNLTQFCQAAGRVIYIAEVANVQDEH